MLYTLLLCIAEICGLQKTLSKKTAFAFMVIAINLSFFQSPLTDYWCLKHAVKFLYLYKRCLRRL